MKFSQRRKIRSMGFERSNLVPILARRALMRSSLLIILILFKNKVNFKRQLSNDEVLNIANNEGKSIIRWGDGETNFYFYGNTASQKMSFKYVSELRRILDDYSGNSPYILCIPNEKQLVLNYRTIFKSPWRDTSALLSRKLDRKAVFGESFLFRNPKNFQKNRIVDNDINILKSKVNYLVENRNRIFLISSKVEHLDLFKFENREKVHQILVPRIDGLNDLETICNQIFSDSQRITTDDIFIVSAGILGKILTFRISLKGFTAIDVGGSLKLLER